MTENMAEEKWVTMKEAAKELRLSSSRISRLAANGVIEVRESKLDRRTKFVNVNQIKELIRTQGIS